MNTERTCRRAAGLAAAGLGYRLFLRRRLLDWGATRGEAAGTLPGDELLPEADIVSTRAITIAAPPADVWPWLVQMGPGERGGAYSYDWIENLLGLDMHSADTVLPQFQHVEQGDVVPDSRGRPWLRFDRVEPQRVLAARSAEGDWVWSFVLVEQAGWTRLLSRNRIRVAGLASRLAVAAMIPGSLVMERKMLLGLKARAEQLAAEREREPAPAETA